MTFVTKGSFLEIHLTAETWVRLFSGEFNIGGNIFYVIMVVVCFTFCFDNLLLTLRQNGGKIFDRLRWGL